MNNIEMARSYFRQAEERVKHAEEAIETGNYAFTIPQSQESVELALKGVLRLLAIEPPKWHDVGPIIKKIGSFFHSGLRIGLMKLPQSQESLGVKGSQACMATKRLAHHQTSYIA